MKKALLLPLFLFLIFHNSYGCGGGLMAYTPSAGNSDNSEKKADFFLINKGVSSTMFDVKALQPLFRDVTASGNERNEKNLSKSVRKKRVEKHKKATEKMLANCTDTTKECQENPHHLHDNENVSPVLNLHKLH